MGRKHRAELALLPLGGTIGMTRRQESGGISPALRAEELLRAVPELLDVANWTVRNIATAPGASVTFELLAQALGVAEQCVRAGADGVIMTHGTDTIEESAYLLDLWWTPPEPFVVTGAMRGASATGADGPANLLAAAIAASDPALRNLGVTVVMADEIHAARHVRKTHSSSVRAFTSPNLGPVGTVREGTPVLTALPPRHPQLAVPPPHGGDRTRVAVVESVLSDDGTHLQAVRKAGFRGVVIAACGVGHVSPGVATEVSALAADAVPVVFSSRTGRGGTHQRTYDFLGSEIDLVRRGAIPAGLLDHRKARLLLWSLLACGADIEGIRKQFALRGGP